MKRVYSPSRSNEIPDRPTLTLVVLEPDRSMPDAPGVRQFVDSLTKDHGESSRTFKSALIWAVPDSNASLSEEATRLLAWEDIDAEKTSLRLGDEQKTQLATNIGKARRDLKESVWRNYKHVMLLGKDNSLREIDLGLIHSSGAPNLVTLILNRLRQDGDVEQIISPNFLLRNWPPALPEWSTRNVRDAFFASPKFPRLLNGDAIKGTISKGVTEGLFAYVGKGNGAYDPFMFDSPLSDADVEISADMFIITADEARKHVEPPVLATLEMIPQTASLQPATTQRFMVRGLDQRGDEFGLPSDGMEFIATGGIIDHTGAFVAGDSEGTSTITAVFNGLSAIATVSVTQVGTHTSPTPPPPNRQKISWTGVVPPQKWMNYYTRVLSQYATEKDLKLTLAFEVSPEDGAATQKVEETKAALRELGLNDDITVG